MNPTKIALLVAGLALWATSALGFPSIGEFQKRLGKLTSSDRFKPRALCVCQDGSVNLHGRAGFLFQGTTGASGTRVKFYCRVRLFDPATGADASTVTCETFQFLPK